jgi:hypothetical protein
MSKTRLIGPIAVAASALVAFVGGNAFAAAQTPHATTLRYTLHFSPLAVIDVGAKDNSLGDEIVSHDIVFHNPARGWATTPRPARSRTFAHRSSGARWSSHFRAE